MMKRTSPLILLPFFLSPLLLPSVSFSQPVTNKTVSDQLLILEERVLERLDNLSARLSKLEEGGVAATKTAAGENVQMNSSLDSQQELSGKIEEFAFTLTNLQQQVESMTKANQKTNEMFQQALSKISKENSYVEKDLSYQVSAIKMTLQDLNYKLYQMEDTLKKRIAAVQEKLGIAVVDEPAYPPISTATSQESGENTAQDKKEIIKASPVVSSVNMEDSYKTAYNDYLRQNYDLAIIGFTAFLQNFPDTSLSDNAQYWIGECYYSQKKLKESIEAFESLLTKFPKSNKKLETKYKIARSYHEMGNNEKALAGYQELVRDFPDTAIADRAKEYIKSISEEKPEKQEAVPNNL